MSTENSNKRNTAIATVAVLLLFGTGVFLSIQMSRNSRLEDELNNEKLSSEALLSHKLSLEKEISKIKSDLSSSQAKSSEIDKLLTETSRKLEAAEQGLKNSQNQSSSVAKLKKQNQELLNQKEVLDQQITNFKNSLNQLQSSNEDLEKTVAFSQKQNKELTAELNALQLSYMNEMLTESSKKNGKLTAKAKASKNLIVNLNVSSQAENLNFVIVSPSGEKLTDKDGTITISTISQNKPVPQAFYVANDSSVPPFTYNRVQMSYLPKKKLSPGLYKIEVLSSSKPIGSLQVKLR